MATHYSAAYHEIFGPPDEGRPIDPNPDFGGAEGSLMMAAMASAADVYKDMTDVIATIDIAALEFAVPFPLGTPTAPAAPVAPAAPALSAVPSPLGTPAAPLAPAAPAPVDAASCSASACQVQVCGGLDCCSVVACIFLTSP